MEKCNYRKDPHQDIDHVFRDLLPAHGMVERPAQVELSHQMLDTMLNGSIALCDAGTGIGKTYAYLVAGVVFRRYRSRAGLPAPADLHLQHRTPGCDHPRLPSVPLQSHDG